MDSSTARRGVAARDREREDARADGRAPPTRSARRNGARARRDSMVTAGGARGRESDYGDDDGDVAVSDQRVVVLI
jgi:hypothetical protein